ncbi:MAG: PIN domain-containing protein [Leptolyngbyaceae cyanobacterium]
MKVLIDTNVIVDVALKRQPFYADSLRVLTLAYQGSIEALISASTVTDIYYLIRKAKGHEATLDFLRIVTAFCQIATVDRTVIANALRSSLKDFEDAVQYESALASQLDAIVTRNPQDFANQSLPIFTPETLVPALGQET